MAGNLLILGGAAASIAAPGGVSSVPQAAEQYPVQSPEFAKCAELATSDGPDEAIGMQARTAKSYSDTKITYRLRSHWEGPLMTDENIACGGIVNYRGSVELRTGKYAQRISENSYRIRTRAQSPASSGTLRAKDYATARQICGLAAELQGRTVPTVKLVKTEKRSYKEPGQPAVRTEDTDFLGKISCKSSDQSGGIRPTRGDGTGGVSVK